MEKNLPKLTKICFRYVGLKIGPSKLVQLHKLINYSNYMQ